MVLVDTSVWIEVFRKKGVVRLEDIVNFDEIVTCLPVVQEVLQGFKDPWAFRIARESMYSLPMVESPLSQDIFDKAIDLYRRARSSGISIRSSVDCLIATCCLEHDLEVLHRDRDYSALCKVSSLRERVLHPTK